MKAVEGYVDRVRYTYEGDRLLLEMWHTMLACIRKRFPDAHHIEWSCEQRKWQYVIFAEIKD